MNKVLDLANSLPTLIVIYVAVLLSATCSFSYFESKPIWDAFWWANVTATTTGYGDMFPVTLGGRITAMLLMTSSAFILLPLVVANILMRIIKDDHKFTDEEQRQVLETLTNIERKFK